MGRGKEIIKRLFGSKRDVRGEPRGNDLEDLLMELEEVQLKKQRISRYVEELTAREAAYKQYDHLEPEDIKKVSGLAQKAKAIEEKKMNLKGRLISNNASLVRLVAYEAQMPSLITEMQTAEKRRRETESHMFYLEEEREELRGDREILIGGYKFLKGISLLLIIVMGVCLLVSFILLQVLREKIWFVLSGIVILAMAFIIGITLIKEKIEKELKDNEILQQKAVRYLNKAKIRFFNQTQYLAFQYQKLGVDSAAKLEMYYNRYLKNKDNEKSYLKLNELLGEIEDELMNILESKHIEVEDVDDLTEWVLQPKQMKEMKMIGEDRRKTEEQPVGLQYYEEELRREIQMFSEEGSLNLHMEMKMNE